MKHMTKRAEHLYVLEFSGGLIKVGRSAEPSKRIAQHVANLAPAGVELLRSEVFECIGAAMRAESELIKQCETACAAKRQNEWFLGVDFELALGWAKCAAERPSESDDGRRFHLRTDSPPPTSGLFYVCRLCCRCVTFVPGSAPFLCSTCEQEGFAVGEGGIDGPDGERVVYWSRCGSGPEFVPWPGVTCEELRPDARWVRVGHVEHILGHPLLEPGGEL